MAGTFKRFRPAVTGRFISAVTAGQRPRTTVAETVKRVIHKLKGA